MFMYICINVKKQKYMADFNFKELEGDRVQIECDKKDFELMLEVVLRVRNGTLDGLTGRKRYELVKLDRSIYHGALRSSFIMN